MRILSLLLLCLFVVATPAQEAALQTLTEKDFNDTRRAHTPNTKEETFLLQVNEQLPPFRFHLLPANGSANRTSRIEITRESQKQTIAVTTRAGAAHFTRLFTVMDVNFDGYLDFAVVEEFGAKWGRLNFWLYEPKTKRFVTNALTRELARLTHNGIEPNPAKQELVVAQFPQATPRPGTLNETYRIANGHLLLVKRELIQQTREGLKAVTQERIQQGARGKLKVTSTQKLP